MRLVFLALISVLGLWFTGCVTPHPLGSYTVAGVTVAPAASGGLYLQGSVAVVPYNGPTTLIDSAGVRAHLGQASRSLEESYEAHFNENVVAAVERVGTFGEVVLAAPEESIAWTDFRVGTRFTFEGVEPDYVLRVDSVAVYRMKDSYSYMGAGGNMMSTSSEGLFHRGWFVLWDNRNGTPIAHGQVEDEVQVRGLTGGANYRDAITEFIEEVVRQTPFWAHD